MDLCEVCGAYWSCEHGPSLEEQGLEHVPPDGPTWRQQYGDPPDLTDQSQAGAPLTFDQIRVAFDNITAQRFAISVDALNAVNDDHRRAIQRSIVGLTSALQAFSESLAAVLPAIRGISRAFAEAAKPLLDWVLSLVRRRPDTLEEWWLDWGEAQPLPQCRIRTLPTARSPPW